MNSRGQRERGHDPQHRKEHDLPAMAGRGGSAQGFMRVEARESHSPSPCHGAAERWG